jgi:hypothetical protein
LGAKNGFGAARWQLKQFSPSAKHLEGRRYRANGKIPTFRLPKSRKPFSRPNPREQGKRNAFPRRFERWGKDTFPSRHSKKSKRYPLPSPTSRRLGNASPGWNKKSRAFLMV